MTKYDGFEWEKKLLLLQSITIITWTSSILILQTCTTLKPTFSLASGTHSINSNCHPWKKHSPVQCLLFSMCPLWLSAIFPVYIVNHFEKPLVFYLCSVWNIHSQRKKKGINKNLFSWFFSEEFFYYIKRAFLQVSL